MTTMGCHGQPPVVTVICLAGRFGHTRNRRHDTAQTLRLSVTSTLVIAPPDLSPRPPLAAVGEVNSVTAGRRHRVLRTELDHAVVEPGPAARIAAGPHPAAPAVTMPRPRAHISPAQPPATPPAWRRTPGLRRRGVADNPDPGSRPGPQPGLRPGPRLRAGR